MTTAQMRSSWHCAATEQQRASKQVEFLKKVIVRPDLLFKMTIERLLRKISTWYWADTAQQRAVEQVTFLDYCNTLLQQTTATHCNKRLQHTTTP